MCSISVKWVKSASLLALVLFIQCMPVKQPPRPDKEAAVIRQADRLIKSGRFAPADTLLLNYLDHYPASDYCDDAAYRRAYIRVIVHEANPFFNYDSARAAFKEFLAKYPTSAYFYACNNWLKVLNLNFELNRAEENCQRTNSRLKKDLTRETRNRKELQKTLNQLEKVLQR